MSSALRDEDDINWRQLVETLSAGRVVEIPCADERDFVRRTNQVTKRAEKHGIAVGVSRGEAILRVEPRGTTERVDDARVEIDRAARVARRAERAQRKEEQRAERERKQ
jgi:hypothetical protein